MRLLLDTHVIVWWVRGDVHELSARTIDLIDGARAVYVSPISVYEIGLKAGDGKLRLPEEFSAGLVDFLELPIRDSHARLAADLPRLHRDPFDRLLIAQAKVERLTLVTRDAKIHQYDVDTLDI